MGTLTRIEVTAAAGRPEVRLATGHLVPRRLRTTDDSVRIALVAAGALLLAGDEVHVEVVVDGPVRLDIVETAGTVAYAMRGGQASWDVDVTLRRAASISWAAEPFIVSDGAEVDRSTRIALEGGCCAAVRESLVFGRTGEAGGALRTSTRVSLDEHPLVVEDLDLTPAGRAGWATLRSHRCLETVSTYGARLLDQPVADATVLQSAGPASLVRRMGGHTHTTQLTSTWEQARRCRP